MSEPTSEGTGWIPTQRDGTYDALWDAAEAKSPSDDGYHFVKCPDCNGTGKVSAT